ncbi:MAG: hypothetical protein JNG83_06025 [Opitutaceae bacterium]|nr:hypothetical protein [Opitutaceae bacterium]
MRLSGSRLGGWLPGWLAALAGVLPLAAAAQGLSLPRPGAELDGEPPLASFRLTFGVTDAAERAWNGRVRPAPGQRLQVEADRFQNHDVYRMVERQPALPNDRVLDEHSWICTTRQATMFVMRGHEAPPPIIRSPTLLVHLRAGPAEEPVQVETPAGSFAFRPRELVPGRAAYFLDGQVRVDALPPVAGVAVERLDQQDFPALAVTRSGRTWVAWQEYDDQADSVLVREVTDGPAPPVMTLAAGVEVLHTAAGEDDAGRLWVVWSMHVDGNWDLYGRSFDGRTWAETVRLTRDAGADAFPRMTADARGRLWLVWQRNAGRGSQIYACALTGGAWTAEERVSEGLAGGNWWPAVAAGPDDTLAVGWDGYAAGNYDVYLRRRRNGTWGPVETVAGTARYEAQPSVAIDARGRVWVAWNESGAEWGKDTGFLVVRKGTQLYESRSIRVACLENGRWMTTAGELPFPTGPDEFWQMPVLQFDGSGQLCLAVRHLLMRRPLTPIDQPTNAALWEFFVVRYDGGRWSDLTYLPRGSGRNDMMPALAPRGDGLFLVWPSDLRTTKSFQPHRHQVQRGYLASAPGRAETALRPLVLEPATAAVIHPREAADVARIRGYRIEHGGRVYSIRRGDFHRHTDISMDGAHDGSLVDAYRYARDAAALDFLALSNHTDGIMEPYSWWRSQKLADLFQRGSEFAAFYGYERSVEWPNGHRNVFFAERGRRITDIPAAELAGEEGAERLYAYLHRSGGFCISHTTGRTSGTDWRNHDPEVESVVEIYQGERDVYEDPDGPKPFRLWSEWLDPAKPVPIESSLRSSRTFRDGGFVRRGLAKGLRLGFIASSDHISTHVSYACLIAAGADAKSLEEAIRARRTYAATDNIVLDVRARGSDGEHLMGEAFRSRTPLQLSATILGTGEILQVDVIKDGREVHTVKPGQAEFRLEYTDAAPGGGESYFYVRVVQRDGNMAWGSPVWVAYDRE